MAPYSFTTKPDTKTRKSTKGKYTLHALLDGHYGEVACIAAHPLGSHVASGGRDGTHIWNLQEKKLLGSPAGAGDRGVTTALAWMIRPDDTDDGLAFGTDDGYLSIWWRSRKEQDFAEVYCNCLEGGEDGQEIAAMAFDATSGQLAIVHRSEIVHQFVVGPLMRLTVVKLTRIKNHWPQAVAFGQTAARGPEIWSFGREDSEINIIDAGGKVTMTKTTGVVIGGAAISVKDDAYILDDTLQGVALYKLSGSERVKTFAVETNERRSRNVCFHDGRKAIVTGSDHGDVYVFDRRTGEVNDIIHVGCKDWVQLVMTTEMEGVPMIIVGRSGEKIGRTALQVWERKTPASRPEAARQGRLLQGLSGWQVICVLLSVLFVLQNLPPEAREWMESVTSLDFGIESVASLDLDTL
ncbi:hypothetical protein D9758_009811 [Tetrapyrgos nigripes]|uniref:WD40 repeat-like protein n=1 Tax=Tetrapyrgos nigripes TaxID=182062 RepID=A0A8H5LR56_9AGAR|nr:hypothetical protein D9758_009811 [Tetrapyrgos nigripes]